MMNMRCGPDHSVFGWGLLLIFLGCLTNWVVDARADEPLTERFLREAPRQWEEYRKLATHVQGHSKMTLYDEKEDFQREAEDAFILDGQSVRFTRVQRGNLGTDRKEVGYAEVVNPRYRFDVDAAKGDQWVLKKLSQKKQLISPDLMGYDSDVNSPDFVLGDRGPFGKAMGVACRGLVLWASWFPRIVASPEFKLIRVTASGAEGDLVKVEFAYEPKTTHGSNPIRSGMVVLDPARYWLILGAEVNGAWQHDKEKGTIKITNEFSDEKRPFVKRQVMRVSGKDVNGQQTKSKWIWNVDLSQLADVDKTQFTLSAFGLPEPVTASSERMSLRSLVFLGSLVLLLLIVVIVARGRLAGHA